MRSVVDRRWGIYVSIAANCGEELVAEPSRLLALGVVALMTWFVAVILHWSSPGGPSWGRYWWSKLGRPRGSAGMIPGPRGLPFVGSMGLMSGLAHRKLATAAKAHGARRIMAFSLGETRVVVTCDPDVAKEILSSSYFADRPKKESAYELMFDRAIGFAPYGPYWRALRRIAATHLFCPKQIAASAHQRADIATEMVGALASIAGEGHQVGVRDILRRASLCNIMSSVFGRRYKLHMESNEVKELRSMVDEGYDLLGKLNWSDHLPFLASLDLQRIRSRSVRLVPKVHRFVDQIIKEHRARRALGSNAAADFVDVLLSLQGADKLSDSDMVAILWEMVFRGTDTVAVLIEWVLARLVLHSDVQSKVHEELDDVVGVHREVNESDSRSLVYLQAVVKETLRVHPPGPLLSWARMSTSDVVVDGKLIPAGTTAMVNMWAITHDPCIWPDPFHFNPDRFMGPDGSAAEMSVLGLDLRLAPFGSGRRSCPGKPLAVATVAFWVASLMHEYEWRPAAGTTGVDLSEVLRLSCEMAAPLTVELRPRRLDGMRSQS